MQRVAPDFEQWVTPKIAAMPRDSRGYPIPANVWRKDNGVPVFAVNDLPKEVGLVTEGRCAVTGTKLDPDDVWLISGPRSAFDVCGVVADAPVCGEAKDFSMRVCPYFSTPNYSSLTQEQRNKLSERYKSTNAELLPGHKVDRHVACRVRGILPMMGERGFTYLPGRDYADMEVWQGGERVESHSGPAGEPLAILRTLQDPDRKASDLSEAMHMALACSFGGTFPWTDPRLGLFMRDGLFHLAKGLPGG